MSQFSRELIPSVAYIGTLAAFLKTEKLKEEMAKKSTPWSIDEVTTFLHLIGDDKIQWELDGTTRNLNVFQEVSALLSLHGKSLLTLCYLLESVVSLSILKLTSNKQVFYPYIYVRQPMLLWSPEELHS